MKTKHSFLASIATFVLAACAALSARAQTPTIITTAPYTILKPGVYQLGADLVYAGNGTSNDAIIYIGISNVTLDFNGHYISGPNNDPATNLIGVLAPNAGNLTIKNGTVAFCRTGIYLVGDSSANSHNINQRVENMLVTYCYRTGVYFQQARNSEIRNCRISFIGGDAESSAYGGIFCTGTGIKVSNNVITNITANTVNTNNPSIGINGTTTTFVIGNNISNCQVGVNGGKYMQNLTSGCTTSYTGGTDAGLNY